jgi:AAA family ATP:ADP antiporter
MLIPTLLMAMSFVVLAASPLPAMVALAQIAQRGSAFGLLQPGRESLYPGQSRMARYKAKTFIDVIVFRAADVVFVWAHQALVLLGAGIPGIAMAGLLLTLGMGFGAWRAARTAQSPATAKVELPAP